MLQVRHYSNREEKLKLETEPAHPLHMYIVFGQPLRCRLRGTPHAELRIGVAHELYSIRMLNQLRIQLHCAPRCIRVFLVLIIAVDATLVAATAAAAAFGASVTNAFAAAFGAFVAAALTDRRTNSVAAGAARQKRPDGRVQRAVICLRRLELQCRILDRNCGEFSKVPVENESHTFEVCIGRIRQQSDTIHDTMNGIVVHCK